MSVFHERTTTLAQVMSVHAENPNTSTLLHVGGQRQLASNNPTRCNLVVHASPRWMSLHSLDNQKHVQCTLYIQSCPTFRVKDASLLLLEDLLTHNTTRTRIPSDL